MRNRRQPGGGLTGEVMPPERDGYGVVRRGDVPGMVTLGELGGTLNIVQRLRAWGQAKGFAAATTMLTEFERSIRAKERSLVAMEDLAIQEARLSGDNFAVLMQVAEKEIDLRLSDISNRLAAEEARGRQADLKSQIEETRLQRQLLQEQRRLDRAMDVDTPTDDQKDEPSLAERITELTTQLNDKQAALEDADEAQEAVINQEIAMLLGELEALRIKHAQSL